ncbi:MAG: hypothetical protein GPJ50_03375 [Candidatus Heimdallarchaeota archaeon]|nr:hypothetical protein [Candidatus Heimdallarchaeota archaeon]
MADEKDDEKEEMKSQEEELEKFFAEDEEKAEGAMTKEDVIAIVRDELKTFWKGVIAGRYPLPKYPYAKKSLEIEDPEGGLASEGIVIPITIKPVVVEEEKSTDTDKTEDKEKDEDEEKSTEKKEGEDKEKDEKKSTDDTKDEQETQITELQKTIETMKKELEDLRAAPQAEDGDEKSTKKEPYRSDIIVENGRISSQ